jgi:hypothetical protein
MITIMSRWRNGTSWHYENIYNDRVLEAYKHCGRTTHKNRRTASRRRHQSLGVHFVMDVGDCSRSIPFHPLSFIQSFAPMRHTFTKQQPDHRSAKEASKTSPKVDWERNHETGGTQSTSQNSSLEPCDFCGRTFLPDRLVVHLRSCARNSKRR